RDVAKVDLQIEGEALTGEVGPQLVHDLRRLGGGAYRLGAEGATELGNERRFATTEAHPDEPSIARRNQHAPDRGRQRAPVQERARAHAAVELAQAAEREAIAGEPPAAGVGPEPARNLARRPHTVDQHRDQRVVVSGVVESGHGLSSSTARSFLSAW